MIALQRRVNIDWKKFYFLILKNFPGFERRRRRSKVIWISVQLHDNHFFFVVILEASTPGDRNPVVVLYFFFALFNDFYFSPLLSPLPRPTCHILPQVCHSRKWKFHNENRSTDILLPSNSTLLLIYLIIWHFFDWSVTLRVVRVRTRVL